MSEKMPFHVQCCHEQFRGLAARLLPLLRLFQLFPESHGSTLYGLHHRRLLVQLCAYMCNLLSMSLETLVLWALLSDCCAEVEVLFNLNTISSSNVECDFRLDIYASELVC